MFQMVPDAVCRKDRLPKAVQVWLTMRGYGWMIRDFWMADNLQSSLTNLLVVETATG